MGTVHPPCLFLVILRSPPSFYCHPEHFSSLRVISTKDLNVKHLLMEETSAL